MAHVTNTEVMTYNGACHQHRGDGILWRMSPTQSSADVMTQGGIYQPTHPPHNF